MPRKVIVPAAAALAAAVGAGIAAVAVWGAGTPEPAAAEPQSVFPVAADYCYAQMMMPHHAQAVEMSEILLAKPDISERSRAFASFVAQDQAREITATQDWIEAWRDALREAPASAIEANDASAHGHSHGGADAAAATAEPIEDIDRLVDCGDAGDPGRFATMAGMLTADQLESLRVAQGLDAEVLFLELMIPHHDGALEMSREQVMQGRNVFLVQMAKHILNEQKREIDAMRTMIVEISS